MSQLQEIGEQVDAAASELGRWCQQLHAEAEKLRQAAARAAQAARGAEDGGRAARAAHALAQAAEACDRAAQHLVAGKAAAESFVRLHVGRGGTGAPSAASGPGHSASGVGSPEDGTPEARTKPGQSGRSGPTAGGGLPSPATGHHELMKTVGIAAVMAVAAAVFDASDALGEHLPAPLALTLSIGSVIKDNWESLSNTPEYMLHQASKLLGRNR